MTRTPEAHEGAPTSEDWHAALPHPEGERPTDAVQTIQTLIQGMDRTELERTHNLLQWRYEEMSAPSPRLQPAESFEPPPYPLGGDAEDAKFRPYQLARALAAAVLGTAGIALATWVIVGFAGEVLRDSYTLATTLVSSPEAAATVTEHSRWVLLAVLVGRPAIVYFALRYSLSMCYAAVDALEPLFAQYNKGYKTPPRYEYGSPGRKGLGFIDKLLGAVLVGRAVQPPDLRDRD